MLAEAWYDNGKIELTGVHRFKHSRFKLRVVLPDEEIELDDNSQQVQQKPAETTPVNADSGVHRVSPTRERLDAILGPWRSKLGGAITPQEIKDIWHQHLEDKYLGPRQ